MAAETDNSVKFRIEGVEYVLPEVDDLDMDEWELMYERTGILFDDFAPLENKKDEAARNRRLNQPGFLRTMLEIAMRRAHPEREHDAIQETAGTAKMIPVLESIGESRGDVADPPGSTPEPAESLPRNSDDSNGSGSNGSPSTSDDPAEHPEPIGT